MAKEKKTELTFGSKRFQQTLSSHKEILDKYHASFEHARKLQGDAKIFLDTNVLLRIYSTSFKARKKLLKFFNDYKSRIVLTGQVQWEYIKNREGVINKFSSDVTKTIPDNFSTDVLNNIISFREKNKSILIDYPKVEQELSALEKSADILLKIIQEAIQKSNISSEEIIYKDEFIALFKDLELLKPLEELYLGLIKTEFDEFLKGIEKSDTDKEAFKAFPGCNEKKEKSDDPYGDYIIYHELMMYATDKACDVIFLTYDTTKGDWMQKNKSPHLHYVENFYQNTGRMLHILDGQRTFDDLLDINFKSLISPIFPYGVEINLENLTNLLNNYPAFSRFPKEKIKKDLVDEILYNGYTTMAQLVDHLDKTVVYFPQIKSSYAHFAQQGYFRACMFIADKSYKQKDHEGNWMRSDFKGLQGLSI